MTRHSVRPSWNELRFKQLRVFGHRKHVLCSNELPREGTVFAAIQSDHIIHEPTKMSSCITLFIILKTCNRVGCFVQVSICSSFT